MVINDLKELITIIIATLGFGLSTFLGIREIIKENRKIKIVLQFRDMSNMVELIIINTGHRPITIMNVAIEIPLVMQGDQGQKIMSTCIVPSNILFDRTNPLPATITDGKMVVISLGSQLVEELFDRQFKPKITIFDAEGHKFTKFERWQFSDKFGVPGIMK